MNWEFFIAGVQHHQYRDVMDKLEDGLELSLVPEPTNQYDSNAVKIILDETLLGYVPAKNGMSAEISAFISWCDNYNCTITHFDKTEKPWKMLKVKIGETEDA